MGDLCNLERFASAQGKNYESALAGLADRQKRPQWMWYVFPQIASLGHSAMAQRYAVNSQEEAQAYLDRPILGTRLRAYCRQQLDLEGRTAHEIFGKTRPSPMIRGRGWTSSTNEATNEAPTSTRLTRSTRC